MKARSHLMVRVQRVALWCAVLLAMAGSVLPHHHHAGMPCLTDDAVFERLFLGQPVPGHASHETDAPRQGCGAHSLYLRGDGVRLLSAASEAGAHLPGAPFLPAVFCILPVVLTLRREGLWCWVAALAVRRGRAAGGRRAPPVGVC